LTYLWLGNNQLSAIPTEIGNLKNLKWLLLNNNQLSGSIPASIGNLTNLTELGLGYNQLSGSIPSSIKNLKALVGLALHDNLLTGNIPEIGNLIYLEAVFLGRNKFTGSVPDGFGNLTNLWWINLEVNDLEGQMPSLEKLTKLQELIIEHNPRLSGVVKLGSQVHISVYALDTNITAICGSASSISSPTMYPFIGATLECLSSETPTALVKRAMVFSTALNGYPFSCNIIDGVGNPYADCANLMTAFCMPDQVTTTAGKDKCRSMVDQTFSKMNSLWIDVRKECGQWPYYGYRGSGANSEKCNQTISNLRLGASYVAFDGSQVPISQAFTESMREGLWKRTELKI